MSTLACHRCHRIVKSHESLLDVNASTYDLIASILPTEGGNSGEDRLRPLRTQSSPRLEGNTLEFTKLSQHQQQQHSKGGGSGSESLLTGSQDNPHNHGGGSSSGSSKYLEVKFGSKGGSPLSPRESQSSLRNKKLLLGEGGSSSRPDLLNTEPNSSDSFVMLASQLAASTLNPYSVSKDDSYLLGTGPAGSEETTSHLLTNSTHPGFTGTPRNFNLNHLLNVQNKLLDKVHGKGEFDQPLCEDCSDILMKVISRKLADATREKAKYIEFSAQRLRSSKTQAVTIEELTKEIEELEIEENSSKLTLLELEKHLDSLRNEIKELEEEANNLDVQEANYWKDLNAYQLQLNQFQNERDSIEAKYQHDQKQLNVLHTTSVYNDLFYIPLRQGIGTINGLRLGRLPPEHPTEWNEINAAWGQTLLALYTVAYRLKFEFQGYRLHPQGSYSTVEKLTPSGVESYALFLPQDSSISRLWLLRRYDLAMTGYLACLDQLATHARSLDPTFKLQYRINQEKIGNHPIHFHFNSLKSWSKALRYTLCNTKILLSFAARHPTTTVTTP